MDSALETASEDLDQAWDNILMVDQKAYEVGFKDGEKVAREKARLEGSLLGAQRGQEIGSEIGFYQGVCQSISRLLPKEDLNGPEKRAWATINKLKRLIQAFPEHNDKDANLAEQLNEIRTKYKQLQSVLGFKIPSPVTANPQQLSW